MQWWPPTGEREIGLLCSPVSYLYPFPWTDVTVGLKLNMLLSHYSTVGGAQGGCLLKVAVGIFIPVTRGQLNFV
jgi:hypothetical protein